MAVRRAFPYGQSRRTAADGACGRGRRGIFVAVIHAQLAFRGDGRHPTFALARPIPHQRLAGNKQTCLKHLRDGHTFGRRRGGRILNAQRFLAERGQIIAFGIIADIPIVGDQTNGLILSILQGLGRAVRDVGQLRGEWESFGTRRQQHAVTTVLIRDQFCNLLVVGLAERKIADAVGPMVARRFRPCGER